MEIDKKELGGCGYRVAIEQFSLKLPSVVGKTKSTEKPKFFSAFLEKEAYFDTNCTRSVLIVIK